MAINMVNADSAGWLAQLAIFALRTSAVAACVGVGLALCRTKSTSLRLLSWTTVLYAAFAIPVLGWLLPSLSVPVPTLVQQAASVRASMVSTKTTSVAVTSTVSTDRAVQHIKAATKDSATGQGQEPSAEIPAHNPPFTIRWSVVAADVYLAIGLLLFIRLVVGLALARRLVRAADRIDDQRVTSRIFSRAQLCGLSFIPQARASALIAVPVTIGAFRSRILLPSAWQEWDDEKLDAVIAHEMSHVARQDALTQCISLLHRAVFWFSPLSWWLNRHLADLAEQASDEAALSGGADRNHYARTLLGFFETLQVSPGRVWWHGVAMANAGQAERRLERILSWRGAVTMGLRKSAVVMIIAFAVPVVYLAASVRPVHSEQTSQEMGARAQVPPPPPSAVPTPAVAPTHPIPTMGVTAPAIAPAPPMLGAVAPPALAGQSGSSFSHGAGHGFGYAFGFDDEERFVIVSGKTDAMTMSGSSADVHHVEKLKKQISGDFIWFQRDEKSYIIRDQATVDRALKLWAPQEELGKKQEELGKQQEALGKQQEELGAKMEQISVKVPDLTAELDKLRAELKALSSTGATVEQVGNLQSEIGELQSKLGDIQSHAGEQQGKLGDEMGALGEKQGKLGEEQGKLGEQQGKLAEQAIREMKVIFDEALKKGTAQPEPGTGGTGSL
jgi:beta-lactamase regulating signal transducer with metallopeptidase domain